MSSGKYEASDYGSAVAFLFVGIGIGAGIGLLLARKTGKELRKDLRRGYDDALDSVSDWADEAKDRLGDVVERTSDFAEGVRKQVEPLGKTVRRRFS